MNKQQKQFLIDRFGKNSIFVELFTNNAKIDVGTKVGLLESALIEPPEEFVQTLDKFVAKLMVGATRLDKSEVTQLYGLKLINDLQFNTTPSYIRSQVRLKKAETQLPSAMRFHLHTDLDAQVNRLLNDLVQDCKREIIKDYSWSDIKQQKIAFAESTAPSNVSFWRHPSQDITEVVTLNCMPQRSTFAFFNPRFSFEVCIAQTQKIIENSAILSKKEGSNLKMFSGVLTALQKESESLSVAPTGGM